MVRGSGVRLACATALAVALSAVLPGLAVAADCGSEPRPGIDWTDCRKRNLMLDRVDLSGAVLDSADITSTDLRNSTLNQTNFVKADMARAMLDGSKAQAANFEKVQGYRTSFANTDLKSANFTKSEMQRANFTNAILTGADFTKSELARAVFTGAEISDTRFDFSNLGRADFRGAIFTTPLSFSHAYLYRTRLEGVDLSVSVGLEQWQINFRRTGTVADQSFLRRRLDEAAGGAHPRTGMALR